MTCYLGKSSGACLTFQLPNHSRKRRFGSILHRTPRGWIAASMAITVGFALFTDTKVWGVIALDPIVPVVLKLQVL